ncbi:alpha-amylase-like [Chelonus insularis]|uniref:alpha-amylase-like n=1 Tax=Chelonus insularis TaxID=460826 RepID=UPI00158B4387|nr:alpha-amylase-like [Chelonus insularis]XP_034949236.1 alpha-amylase-like [Chelonus insularis]
MCGIISRMEFKNICIVLLIFYTNVKGQKNPHYRDDRSTMVHLFEWKFDDIADECERFLGPKGYGGVQVSPVSENLIIPGRPWYERYQPISMKIASRSGNEESFKQMVQRCNKADVRIYVDVVINHMTGDANPAVGVDGSIAKTDERLYPAVPFTFHDFHRVCAINNYRNATEVRNCELSGLHDLDQSKEHVRNMIVDFLNRLIDMGVAGFRIDAAKHMWPEDLKVIYSRMNNLSIAHGFPPNARPFIYQEVIDLGGEAVSKKEYTSFARVIEFTFGIVLGNIFRGNEDLKYLKNWGNGWGLLKSDDALVMIDNHDNQRGHGAGGASILTYKVPKQYKMAVVFELAHPYGLPRVMSSYYFDDPSIGPPAYSNGTIISPEINSEGVCTNGWVCEHRWRQIYQMVIFRSVAKNSPLQNWWDNDDDQIAFSRGDLGFVAINGDDTDLRQVLHTGLPAGKYCDVISGEIINGNCTGKIIEVDKNRMALIEIPADSEDGCLAIHIGRTSLVNF